MPAAYIDAQQFIALWNDCRSEVEFVKRAGYASISMAYQRRRKIESQFGIKLPAFGDSNKGSWPEFQNEAFNQKSDYTIVIGSDKHCKPGHRPQALNAFIDLLSDVKPKFTVINGDWFDFPSIGRFHRIGWEERPSIKEELNAGIDDLKAIRDASPKSKRIFTIGNHDLRYDGKLSNCLPEMEDVPGLSLEHQINVRAKLGYTICLSAVFNDCFIVKHRWHNGVHSSYNDVLKGGKNIATGHDHKLNIRPWSDYSGTRYGIKTGTLSDLWDECFTYMENNPGDWQPGCVVVEVLGNIIHPTACYMIYDKHHPKRGKISYGGKWYG